MSLVLCFKYIYFSFEKDDASNCFLIIIKYWLNSDTFSQIWWTLCEAVRSVRLAGLFFFMMTFSFSPPGCAGISSKPASAHFPRQGVLQRTLQAASQAGADTNARRGTQGRLDSVLMCSVPSLLRFLPICLNHITTLCTHIRNCEDNIKTTPTWERKKTTT